VHPDGRALAGNPASLADQEAAALVVCHGGGIEPDLVARLPDADHSSWGAPFVHCDGARLAFDGHPFVSIVFSSAPTILPT
jgi:hypothetical protein